MKIFFKIWNCWPKVFFIILFLVLKPALVNAQLAQFTATATVTDESCSGSGGVSFAVTGATPGADFLYTIYALPGMNIVYSGPNTSSSGLTAGNYTAVIIETLGSESVTVSLDFTVDDATSGLVYTIEAQAQNCAGGNTIVITMVTGNATSYEIIGVAPPQSSNSFTGLESGTYNIRVYDDCGQGYVTTFTAIFDPQPPVFESPVFDSPVTSDCTTVTLTSSISYDPGTIISYPLTIVYTIYPSDGSPAITDTQYYETGALTYLEFSHSLTYTPGVTYTYDILITNACGNTFHPQGLFFDGLPKVTMTNVPLPCEDYYIDLAAMGYHAPYTVNFTSVPAGFNPVDFNANYPGPYTDASMSFGGPGMPVPEGSYTATITDSCNRTSEPFTLEITHQEVVPVATGNNNSCFSNYIRALVPDRLIVTAIITAAPADYGQQLPHDVSAYIQSSGVLYIPDLPLGDYVLTLIDSCGDEYIDIPLTISPYEPKGFTATAYADCTIAIGALSVDSDNGKLVSITMTGAPFGFTEPLPYDVTALIDPGTGNLFMDNLPAGTYNFTGTDDCDVTANVSVTITGYQPGTGTPFTFYPYCNSFDIELTDNDTSSFTPTYWLQREDPANPGQWGHPDTQALYDEGTAPNSTNSVQLTNGQFNYNLQYFGVFRIIKSFSSVGNGSAPKVCTEVLGDIFEYFYDVTINEIYSIDCATYPNSLYVDATGLAPLHYYALDANFPDSDVVIVDNGNNPIFSNLPSGTYIFMVENSCLQSQKLLKDVNTLPDLVDAQVPANVAICLAPGESPYQEIDLTQQNAQILGGVSPDLYLITYYTSQADADAGLNAIADPQHFVNTSNPQTIYARMEQVYIMVCPEVVSFVLETGENPVISVNETQYLCEELGTLTLDAGPGYDTYLWMPGGETTQTITVTEPGDYGVEVRYNNTLTSCPANATITVLPMAQPEIIDVVTQDWTYDQNSFTVIMDNPALYEYSLDNINYQASNTFMGLPTGIYTIFVRDIQHCGIDSQVFDLLYYPNFFTPNGDGENEFWRIQYGWFEPKLLTYIYDRYGKLVKYLDANDQGWDGTFNGNPLPATDYWFVVIRQDGQIHKGHFSLLR